MTPYGAGYPFDQPPRLCPLPNTCELLSYLLVRQHEKHEMPWCCATTAELQLKHQCVNSTAVVTNPKQSSIWAAMKKINPIPAKTSTTCLLVLPCLLTSAQPLDSIAYTWVNKSCAASSEQISWGEEDLSLCWDGCSARLSHWSVVPVTLLLLVLALSQISLMHCLMLVAAPGQFGPSAVCFCSLECTALSNDK